MADPPVLEPMYLKGELKRPTVALQELMSHPKAFLLKHPISIDEDATASGVKMAHLMNGVVARRPGKVLGTLRMHRTESFQFSMLKDEGHSFQAHYVRMEPSNGPNNPITWYPLTGGPSIMLTCKLTGCSFIVRMQAGVLQAAHLQPAQETGLQLNTRLQGVAGQYAWGRLKYDYERRQVSVVGVRSGGTWEIYAQKVDKMKEVGIMSVHRVYPPE